MIMNYYLNKFLNVPVSDPDDARRRRVLNILLLGTILATIFGIFAIVFGSSSSGGFDSPNNRNLLVGTFVSIVGITVIYLINRLLSGRWAALLFLLLLTLVFYYTDTPKELSNGRSTLFFMLPITISSLILLPEAVSGLK